MSRCVLDTVLWSFGLEIHVAPLQVGSTPISFGYQWSEKKTTQIEKKNLDRAEAQMEQCKMHTRFGIVESEA